DPEALPGPDAAYGFSVLIRDVTEVRRLRRELSESRARYRRLFRQAPAALHSMNREERLVEVSDQWLEALGYERGEVIGRHPKELLTEESRRRAEEVELPRFWERGWARDVPYQFVRKDGELRDILLSSVVQRDEDGSPVGTLTVLNDVTERKAAERELTFRALHHPLTGLPNRALFRDRLAQALARSGRRKTRVAVLFVDLDRFKVVNDTLGHVAGDRLLRAVARRFAECMRAEDTLAHHGGDEFVVLLEGVEEEAAVVKVAERLTGTLQEPFEIAGSRLLVTASIGFALAGRGDPLDAILRNADVAMYRAKEEGGGSVHAYDPRADYQVTERLELETELQRALEEREFELHWQPVVELASGQPCMVEALVRWRHPRRGLLAPREFIGAAEESGIIVPLGEWVLETAGAQLREWKEAELLADCTALSVNLSARQLRQPGFREVVARVVEEGGFEPWRLQLEITESVLMESGPELEALKRMRVKLAIDDFGTGYSSLAYLKQFPVDALKIDRRFVEGLGRDPADRAICGAITAVAKSMNLLIIAEGVETPEQLEELKRLGCGWAQGYLFARPMPPGKMRKLLASKRKLA
ncbi:MAG: putative bifunctional diguanylate cyclase/phosphodiesterase, partial [Gemmatimonadota bacterium]